VSIWAPPWSFTPPLYDWIVTGNVHAHTQNGGRIWHQQPQTIKGVKVLPFLNCSSIQKKKKKEEKN